MSHLTSGTYILTNAMSGTAMEVWLGHNGTVRGNLFSGNANQQWRFIAHGDGTFAIRSMLRGPDDGSPLFLCPSDAGIRQCSPLVVGPLPVGWAVEDSEHGLVIRWPKTNLAVDLDEGRGSPHTAINLCRLPEEDRWRRCSQWPYTRCFLGDVGSSTSTSDTACVMPVSIFEGSDTDCVAVRGSLSDVQPTAWAPSHACYSDGHREPNRKWEFVPYGDGHAIRSCYQEENGQALYLSVEGPPAKWARIVASPQPVGWHIEHAYPNETESSYFQPIRIRWPHSKFVISLGNSGSSEDGTHVELDIWSPVYRCYMWECLPV